MSLTPLRDGKDQQLSPFQGVGEVEVGKRMVFFRKGILPKLVQFLFKFSLFFFHSFFLPLSTNYGG